MLLVGESINGTRKQVAEAIQSRDAEFIKKLALDQVEAGAGILDVNGGVAGGNELEDLVWLIETVRSVTDMQLMIDSANAEVVGPEVVGVERRRVRRRRRERQRRIGGHASAGASGGARGGSAGKRESRRVAGGAGLFRV